MIGESRMTLWKRLAALTRYDRDIAEQAVRVNVERLLYLSLIGIPASGAHILWFIFWVDAGTHGQSLWRAGIIAAHTVLVAVMAITLVLCVRWKYRPIPWMRVRVMSDAFFAFTLAAGVAIVSIDQLVTTNVTPFMAACFIAAVYLRVRPRLAMAAFTVALCAYMYGIAVFGTDPQVIASNRVNGITVAAIAVTLNLALWQNHRIRVRQERQIESQREQLEAMAYQDLLTGIYNRRFMEEAIEKEISLMRRHGHESSLVLLDVDDFKAVNDTYGHPAGDAILEQVAKVLAANVRQYDTLARLGGDEFAVMLPHTSPAMAAETAQRLIDAVQNVTFQIGNRPVAISMTAGAALLGDGDYLERSDYYARADAALYEAKRAGKSGVGRL